MRTDELERLAGDRPRFGDYVYTPLAEVVDLWRRRHSGRFSAMPHETAIGAKVPAILRGGGPVGVLFRQIGSPNYETRRVARLCAQHGIRLVIWEYHEDLFAPENRDKYALGRMGFYGGLGRNGGRRIEYMRIIDVEAMNRRRLKDITTFRDESLIDFHHRLLAAECPEIRADALYDGSQWFADHGGSARQYYAGFVSLFLRHAILFETFVLQDAGEREFTREVFLPVFSKLAQTTGLKPLVVQAEREDWEGDEFWQLYPEPLRRHIGPYRVRDQVAVDLGLHWETPADREVKPVLGNVTALAVAQERRAPLARVVGGDER